MDISFGVGIRRFLFRQNIRDSHDEIRSRIIQQVNKYLPYIQLLLIDIESPETNKNISDNLVIIKIEYNIEPYNQREVLELPISL